MRSGRFPLLALICLFYLCCNSLPAIAQTSLPLLLISKTMVANADAIAADPSVSADGRRIAFWSNVADLVPGDTNGYSDVFVYDTVTTTLDRVSISSTRQQASNNNVSPVISGDGRFVVFESTSSNFTGVADGVRVLVRKDLNTGALDRVSPAALPNLRSVEASQASISGNGQIVAFNLTLVDSNGGYAATIGIRDMNSATISQPVMGIGGAAANGFSFTPSISSDGRFVAFHSYATNLVADAVSIPSVYLLDRLTGAISLVSKSAAGLPADGGSLNAAISGNGQYVVFESTASNLANVIPGTRQFYRADLVNHKLDLISTDARQVPAYDPVAFGFFTHTSAISADGSKILFQTLAQNLGADDLNSAQDIYLKDMTTGSVQAVACAGAGLPDTGSTSPAISANGAIIAFNATGLLTGAPPGGGVYVTGNPGCPILPPKAIDTGWWTFDGKAGWGGFTEINTISGNLFFGLANYDDAGEPVWEYGVLNRMPNSANGFSGTLYQFHGGQGSGPIVLGITRISLDQTSALHLSLPLSLGGTELTGRRYAIGNTVIPADPRIRLQSGWWWAPDRSGMGLPMEIQGSRIYLAQLDRGTNGGSIWRSALFDIVTPSSNGIFNEVRGGPSFLIDRSGPFGVSNPVPFVLDQYAGTTARLTVSTGAMNIQKFNQF